jgi:membrane associated rhomboid family serine protease
MGSLIKDFKFATIYLAVMWGLEMFLPMADYFGIRPGQADTISLIGIFSAPFLHGNAQHLIGNTIGYVPLASLTILKAPGQFNKNFWIISVLTGAAVWVMGQPGSIHVGASGTIYGFFGFCLLSAVFRLDFPNLVCAVLTWIVFQDLIGGMSPTLASQGISWEGHLFGFLSGAIAGYLDSISQQKQQEISH